MFDPEAMAGPGSQWTVTNGRIVLEQYDQANRHEAYIGHHRQGQA